MVVGVGLIRLPLATSRRDASFIAAAASSVSRRLYVHLRGDWCSLSVDQILARLQFIYHTIGKCQPELDARVVLPCTDDEAMTGAPEVDALLGDSEDEVELSSINALRISYGVPSIAFLPLEGACTGATAAAKPAGSTEPPVSTFEHVCVGGTFDYLHVGHKLLLSLSAHVASRRLVVGVSDAPLLTKKALRELMQPVELRVALVEDFLRAIKPSLVYEIIPIQDAYGPATRDAALQAIVVSDETAKGGEACNVKRAAGAHSDGEVLPPMQVLVMALVDADGSADADAVSEETKVSSTDARKRQLGALRGGEAHWCRQSSAGRPYVVGLTGGIASGKSTACRMLNELGGATLETVDCDRLAHRAYEPATPTFAALVEEFGEQIVAADGTVDRKALGAIVFADDGGAAMKRLTDIAWPATAALAAAAIEQSSAEIVVMEV